VPLQATVERRARQMRDGGLERVEAVVQRQQRMTREATITASSSIDSTVDLATFGPVDR
jgi:hypothetical protein